ncbi:GNAT family N-acetyltransferase [Agrilactobacillus yilanensis]|uniref:GNAT family N-acetyltransferase n=1 Tax=Agrilactobacillus yilanensis TaxID=2485997 RepID=A0ABW4JAG2_9LACO|nr:GNAT family protein [Agrilactobacillus yilanensis]
MFQAVVNEHVKLRKLSIRDAQPLYALIQKNRAALPEYGHMLPEDMTDFVRDRLAKEIIGQAYNTVILVDDEVVGSLDLHNIDTKNRRGEFGYWLDRDYQHQGIMTACVSVLVKILFEELHLNRLEIRLAATNNPSRQVAERLGFQLEGILRAFLVVDGQYEDIAIYSFLKSDLT